MSTVAVLGLDIAPRCQECGEETQESPFAKDDAPLVFHCVSCGLLTCDNCGSGGKCSSCDCDHEERNE